MHTLTHSLETTFTASTLSQSRSTAKASNETLKMTLTSVKFSISNPVQLNSNSLIHRLDRHS